jgi:hypothetical protein
MLIYQSSWSFLQLICIQWRKVSPKIGHINLLKRLIQHIHQLVKKIIFLSILVVGDLWKGIFLI